MVYFDRRLSCVESVESQSQLPRALSAQVALEWLPAA